MGHNGLSTCRCAYKKGASNEQLIEVLRNDKITWLNKSKM